MKILSDLDILILSGNGDDSDIENFDEDENLIIYTDFKSCALSLYHHCMAW